MESNKEGSNEINLENQQAAVGELLAALLGGDKELTGAQRLRRCPSTLPKDGPSGEEVRQKNVKFLKELIDNLVNAPLDRIDTLIVGFRVVDEDGFHVEGAHHGNAETIFSLSLYLDELLEDRIRKQDADEARAKEEQAG